MGMLYLSFDTSCRCLFKSASMFGHTPMEEDVVDLMSWFSL